MTHLTPHSETPPPPAEISRQSSQDSKYTAHRMSQTQQWPQETCWSLNIKEHEGHSLCKKSQTSVRLVCDFSSYFLVAPCLCVDSQTGSDGGGTGPSRDPCHHSQVSDTDSPSCLHAKHLLAESHTKLNTYDNMLDCSTECNTLQVYEHMWDWQHVSHRSRHCDMTPRCELTWDLKRDW